MQKLKCLSLVATALFFIIFLYASSLRPPYVHLLFNLLIVAVGTEAGILGVFFKSTHNSDTLVVQPNVVEEVICICPSEGVTDDTNTDESIKMGCKSENLANRSDNTLIAIVIDIEDTETPLSAGTADNEDGENVEGITEMELFARAEEFIEQFYKQLKMQRDEQYNSQSATFLH